MQQNILLQLSSFTLRFLSMSCAQMHTLSLSQALQASQTKVGQVANATDCACKK